MGLDISVYVNVEPLPETGAWDEEVDYDHEVRLYQPLGFEERSEGQTLPGRHGDGIQFGDFRAVRAGSFCAGSYSGYNYWRRNLAELAGVDLEALWAAGGHKDGDCPFGEILNFSDCEGFLGTVVCNRLRQDFEAYHSAAQVHFEGRSFDLYEEFMRAFQTAADNNGVVVFH